MFEAAKRLAFLIREKRQAYTLGQMFSRLLPERFDLLLYEGDAETLAAVPHVEGAPDVEVQRFDAAHLSGFPEIDEKAVGRREVYAVIIDGRVAHRVVLTWDITVPARFGLDAKAPVMDLGFTWPEFVEDGCNRWCGGMSPRTSSPAACITRCMAGSIMATSLRSTETPAPGCGMLRG